MLFLYSNGKEVDFITNQELNTRHYQKMFDEQEHYRQHLLTLPPAEILYHAYEYTNIIHPTTRRTSNRLPMPENVRKGFRRYSCAVLTGAMILGLTMPAYAANDPLTVVNNLSTFIFGLIRAVGLILLGWGIVQVGLSLQSHDPSQRSNGFLTLAGGIVITFAKEILDLIIA